MCTKFEVHCPRVLPCMPSGQVQLAAHCPTLSHGLATKKQCIDFSKISKTAEHRTHPQFSDEEGRN